MQNWALGMSRSHLPPERMVPQGVRTHSAPCPQTMERQTNERVELYAKKVVYGPKLPNNGDPLVIKDNVPMKGEI